MQRHSSGSCRNLEHIMNMDDDKKPYLYLMCSKIVEIKSTLKTLEQPFENTLKSNKHERKALQNQNSEPKELISTVTKFDKNVQYQCLFGKNNARTTESALKCRNTKLLRNV